MGNHDWAACVATELILGKSADRYAGSVIEECVGVQNLVAEEFISISVKAVGSRLGRKTDDAASKTVVLGRQVVRLHFELLQRILSGNQCQQVEISMGVEGRAVPVGSALISCTPVDLDIPLGKGVQRDGVLPGGSLGNHAGD